MKIRKFNENADIIEISNEKVNSINRWLVEYNV